MLWTESRFSELGANPFHPGRRRPIQSCAAPSPRKLKTGVQTACPNSPGVYCMIDDDGQLIYVGKSKHLRTRLLTYFSPRESKNKPGRIIQQTHTLVWETAPSEFAALLRELHLIQTWQPVWNVRDKPRRYQPAYVCLGRKPAPYLFTARQPPRDAIATFGPLYPGRVGLRAIEVINRHFGLRDCPNSQPMSFADQRELFSIQRSPGCLRYELGTCLGPCVRGCTRSAYYRRVNAARAFLEGANDRLVDELERPMHSAATALQYERAGRLRDDLDAVLWLRERLNRIAEARRNFTFVYPVGRRIRERLWYLIAGGRVVDVVRCPQSERSAINAASAIESRILATPTERNCDRGPTDSVDTFLTVMRWFRQFPAELERVHSPQRALESCEKRLTAATV